MPVGGLLNGVAQVPRTVRFIALSFQELVVAMVLVFSLSSFLSVLSVVRLAAALSSQQQPLKYTQWEAGEGCINGKNCKEQIFVTVQRFI